MINLFLQLNAKILLILVISGFIIGKLRGFSYCNFTKKPFGDFLINFFNLIGIPIHETGHLLFGILFGFHIQDTCFYRTRKQASKNGGTLGYVKMNHRSNTFFSRLQGSIGKFFVGIGPLIFGPAFILTCIHFLPEQIRSLQTILEQSVASRSISISSFSAWFHALSRNDLILFFAFLYVIIGVSLNLELSKKDLNTALQGVFVFEVLLLIIAYLSVRFGWNLQTSINFIYSYNILICGIGVFCSIIVFLISLI